MLLVEIDLGELTTPATWQPTFVIFPSHVLSLQRVLCTSHIVPFSQDNNG
jgi:hypothetical protein